MPRSAIVDPVMFTANRIPDRAGHVYGRKVTVFYQYGHVSGLMGGHLDSNRFRSISAEIIYRLSLISGPN